MVRLSSMVCCVVAWVVSVAWSADPAIPRTVLKPDNQPGLAGKPIRVFILMGQSNMLGMGDIGPETAKGTLTYLTKTDKKYPWLTDDDAWTERKDV